MNFKYVLRIIKRRLRVDLHRQCRVQKLCHVGKENSHNCSQTAGEPAVTQSSCSWFLQRKSAVFLSLCLCALVHGSCISVCTAKTISLDFWACWVTHCTAGKAPPGVNWWMRGCHQELVTREAQVSLQMMKVGGLALANSKKITSW